MSIVIILSKFRPYLNPVHPCDSELVVVGPGDPGEVGLVVGEGRRGQDPLLLDAVGGHVGKPELNFRVRSANLK